MACDYTPIRMSKMKIAIPKALEKYRYSSVYSADVKWYSPSGNSLTGFYTFNHMANQLHSWAFIPEK